MTKIWKDESGITIPANRVTNSEKTRERAADKLLKNAHFINDKLARFKMEFSETVAQVYNEVMAENGVDISERKGNFTFYNFDRSIKLETDINERIDFDDAMIAVAKEHFDNFLSNGTGSVDAMIRELIMNAFSTSRGKLDVKKLLGLLKYRTRIPEIKYPEFHLALNAIEKGIRRVDSKTYHRISMRGSDGKYMPIDLNFSSI
ncbi:MAG: DUF3164 family protein [Bacteroidales bacterium]|nr:DUF3164 family protein [Bacteroidales bacterium]